jgi:hypothetical protein
MKLNKIFPLNDHNKKIEFHLFEIAIFLTVVIFSFWSVFSFLNDFKVINKIIFVSGSLAYFAIYIAQKREFSFNIVASLYFGLSFFLMIFAWLPGGGIKGAILQFIVLIFISGLLVLPLRAYLAYILATALVVISFSIYEFYNPGAALPYTNEINRIRDISIASIIMITVLGFCLFTFKRSYVRDRESLNKAIEEIIVEKIKA